MIPAEVAALADALQREDSELDRDAAVRRAYTIVNHLGGAGFYISQPVGHAG